MRLRRRAATLLLALAVPVVGCGGGGDGGTTTAPCLTLSAPALTTRSVAPTKGPSSTCELLDVAVVIQEVSGVFGAEFTAAYDPSVVDYVGYSDQTSHLRSDGADVTTLVSDRLGMVVLGITRTGATSGVDFGSAQPLIRLTFRRVSAAGTQSPLAFQSAFLYSAGTPPQPLPNVTWHDGTFIVQ